MRVGVGEDWPGKLRTGQVIGKRAADDYMNFTPLS
jgi:hypothetical protein